MNGRKVDLLAAFQVDFQVDLIDNSVVLGPVPRSSSCPIPSWLSDSFPGNIHQLLAGRLPSRLPSRLCSHLC